MSTFCLVLFLAQLFQSTVISKAAIAPAKAASLDESIKLTWQPQPEDKKTNLIWFNKTSYESWSNSLDNYLEVYRTPSITPGRLENLVKCNHSSHPQAGGVCHVSIDTYSPCVSTNYFGYKKLTPCVFIEIEKVPHWKPKFYTDMADLPKDIPEKLKNYIDEKTVYSYEWENVWVSCEGETSADQEFIGSIQYIPEPAFPAYFYPYDERPGYLSPVVAVHFQHPKHGVIINVECKLWAPNIEHDRKKGIGLTRFQILID
ncbi:hypothetical protein LSTR_LSTR009509 [Laodelphax striatellus]|uniref:Sodium/potassium-transporting ATPase subunit beta-2 n=1 Tax=Laodelphax striatellus TaxID=195883 RepID=A0A482WEW5_LAOST|nr:hypothetical protein LSTR_LSTR009509 [Laodelphax striatellus]